MSPFDNIDLSEDQNRSSRMSDAAIYQNICVGTSHIKDDPAFFNDPNPLNGKCDSRNEFHLGIKYS